MVVLGCPGDCIAAYAVRVPKGIPRGDALRQRVQCQRRGRDDAPGGQARDPLGARPTVRPGTPCRRPRVAGTDSLAMIATTTTNPTSCSLLEKEAFTPNMPILCPLYEDSSVLLEFARKVSAHLSSHKSRHAMQTLLQEGNLCPVHTFPEISKNLYAKLCQITAARFSFHLDILNSSLFEIYFMINLAGVFSIISSLRFVEVFSQTGF